MTTRITKILLVWMVALFALLVVFNNLTDYNSNYQFVSHVLSMDTTFPGNQGMWRAITTPAFHHAAYALIILSETVVAVLCLRGGFLLFKARGDAARFNRAKGGAVLGLAAGVVLWFTGFITIGGEWFLMWQSHIWNGQDSAFRFVVILGVVLIFVNQEDR
jgi:predicted small integral membrane protein